MIECSFFLSVVGLVISVLISYSKWVYHHFSLAIGGPKKRHIRAFNTRKTEIQICYLSIYLLILQHPLAGIMCRCPVCFRPGFSAVKVKIGQMDKNR